MQSYIELGTAATLPAVAAVILFCLEKRGRFDKIPKWGMQVIYGIIYGIFAILGTEFGIPMNGAQINCRDASVLTAGLVFGGPAGLIAGLIGGTERWIAVAWGIGTYTRVACTLSTFFAGVFSAMISRFMLEKKKPTPGMTLFIGITVEVFHLSMVFFTNMKDASNAIQVVRSCTITMVVANGLSVFLAVVFVSIAAGEFHLFGSRKRSETPVFEIVQQGMLTVIMVSLIITCIFVYRLEDNQSVKDTTTLLDNAASDVSDELERQVDDFMTEECKNVWNAMYFEHISVEEAADEYGISEIFTVDNDGIILESNIEDYVGFDMSNTDQFKDILCMLHIQTEYVQDYGKLFDRDDLLRKTAIRKTVDGYILITYDSEKLNELFSDQITNLATNRHVGTHGYVLVTNEENGIVSITKGYSNVNLTRWLKSMPAQTESLTKAVINDASYYYLCKNTDSYRIWSVYPVDEASITRDIMVYVTIFVIILVFMAVYIMLYMIIKKIIVDQIEKMAGSLSMISAGNLNEVVDVRSNEEFASLSNDINRTVDTLKTYIAEAAARIDKELELASTIQLSALPRSEGAFRYRKDFEIYARTDPAKEVGGDFYDFYFTGDNEFNIMIADVSDKGIPAAMFMMRAKSTLKDMTEKGSSIDDVFTEGNNSLCNGNEAEMFVTAWQGKIHLDSGLVEFVNAGHDAPLVKHGDEPFIYLKQKRNLVLGAMEEIPYRKQKFEIQPGDIILLYTDGVVEATDINQQLYGAERLLNIVNSGKYETMKELMAVVRQDVDEFVGEAPQFDDLTMLAFRYNGSGEMERL